MKFLLGTVAYNQHIQNIALALYEASALGVYCTGGVDNYHYFWARQLRRRVEKHLPTLDRLLSRRRVTTVPDHIITKDWKWEGLRMLADRLGFGSLAADWFWERSEFGLDRKCARLIRNGFYNAFLGVEHGCLYTIKTARRTGKKSVVTFVSPHHATREKWVDAEYERFPDLLNPATRRLLEKGRERDQRRDEEANLADAIHTNSRFTTDSLIAAGFDPKKIVTVPLGSPTPISKDGLLHFSPSPMKFLYAGPISVRKGAHYLLMAWKKLQVIRNVELHFYGIPLLPKECLTGLPKNVYFHSSVSQPELFSAFRQGSILVFPSLCDGFGMVVLEAMAQGLPVMTTPNVGASLFIEEGRNGFLIPPSDEDALVKKLEWCIEHASELFGMRQQALLTAENWTWADYRSSLIRQLRSLLNWR